jgi:hypothetical protein
MPRGPRSADCRRTQAVRTLRSEGPHGASIVLGSPFADAPSHPARLGDWWITPRVVKRKASLRNVAIALQGGTARAIELSLAARRAGSAVAGLYVEHGRRSARRRSWGGK